MRSIATGSAPSSSRAPFSTQPSRRDGRPVPPPYGPDCSWKTAIEDRAPLRRPPRRAQLRCCSAGYGAVSEKEPRPTVSGCTLGLFWSPAGISSRLCSRTTSEIPLKAGGRPVPLGTRKLQRVAASGKSYERRRVARAARGGGGSRDPTGRSCSTCRPIRKESSSSGAVPLGTRTGQPLPQAEAGDAKHRDKFSPKLGWDLTMTGRTLRFATNRAPWAHESPPPPAARAWFTSFSSSSAGADSLVAKNHPGPRNCSAATLLRPTVIARALELYLAVARGPHVP